MSAKQQKPLSTLKGVRILNSYLNLKDATKLLNESMPKHQVASMQTALARLKAMEMEQIVIVEWAAGMMLYQQGKITRFNHAASFFFLFGKACKGSFSPVWIPTLNAQMEIQEAEKVEREKQKQIEDEEEKEAIELQAEIQRRAQIFLETHSEEELRKKALTNFGKPSASASLEIIAEALAGLEVEMEQDISARPGSDL